MSKILVIDKTIHLVQEYMKSCSVDGKLEGPKPGFESEFVEAAEELKELCEIKSLVIKDTLPARAIDYTSESEELTILDLLDEQMEMLKHNLVCFSSDLRLSHPKVGFEKSYDETRKRMELVLEIYTIVEQHEVAFKKKSTS